MHEQTEWLGQSSFASTSALAPEVIEWLADWCSLRHSRFADHADSIPESKGRRETTGVRASSRCLDRA
ncbi:hypothetical protein NY08_3960 [Rhodococcus sp. B7740]|nr:hypothetical protein NY08_3960 [Rhodococcus sp. B7740]